MAAKKRKRMRPAILQEDIDAYNALLAIADYNPSNGAFELASVTASKTTKETKQTAKTQADAAAAAAGDAEIDAEWNFHDMILGVKTQVRAQYGEDSDEYASLGLKKKSEYKRGGRRASPVNPT